MTTATSSTARAMAATAFALVLTLCGSTLTTFGTTPQAAVTAATPAHHADPGRVGGRVDVASTAFGQTTRIALYAGMRTAWAQHMEWTYATVVAFAAASPALGPTLTRLLANQADIGDAIATYYGATAGGRLTDLLQVHIQDAVPVLTAAKDGDTAALTQAVAAWYANAQDLADFLARLNPNWKQADMRSMMHTHITQTIAYAADILAGNYTSAIQEYDAAEAHMTEMADMLSAGIIRQFPQRFSHRFAGSRTHPAVLTARVS